MRKFEGEIILVETSEKLDSVLPDILKETLLGFDTETKPSFQKGAQNKVSVLQLSTNTKAWIFRLEPLNESLDKLYKVLESEEIKKVGLAIAGDIKALRQLKNFTPAGFEEISKYTQKIGIINTGMKNLCAAILGERISKSAQLSNWASEILTQKQLDYAATDAWMGLRLYEESLKILSECKHCLYIETPIVIKKDNFVEKFKAAFKKIFG